MALQIILHTAVRQIFIISGSKLVLQSRGMPRVVVKRAVLPLGCKDQASYPASVKYCSPAHSWSTTTQESHSVFPGGEKKKSLSLNSSIYAYEVQ